MSEADPQHTVRPLPYTNIQGTRHPPDTQHQYVPTRERTLVWWAIRLAEREREMGTQTHAHTERERGTHSKEQRERERERETHTHTHFSFQ